MIDVCAGEVGGEMGGEVGAKQSSEARVNSSCVYSEVYLRVWVSVRVRVGTHQIVYVQTDPHLSLTVHWLPSPRILCRWVVVDG